MLGNLVFNFTIETFDITGWMTTVGHGTNRTESRTEKNPWEDYLWCPYVGPGGTMVGPVFLIVFIFIFLKRAEREFAWQRASGINF